MACQHCCEHKNLEIRDGTPHCKDCHKTWPQVVINQLGNTVPVPYPYPVPQYPKPFWYNNLSGTTQLTNLDLKGSL